MNNSQQILRMLHNNIKSEQCRSGISDHARLSLNLMGLAVDRTIEDISALSDPNFHLKKQLSDVGRDIVKEAAAPIERMATVRALEWAYREVGLSKAFGGTNPTSVAHNNTVAECQTRIFKGIQRVRKHLSLGEVKQDKKNGPKLDEALLKALVSNVEDVYGCNCLQGGGFCPRHTQIKFQKSGRRKKS